MPRAAWVWMSMNPGASTWPATSSSSSRPRRWTARCARWCRRGWQGRHGTRGCRSRRRCERCGAAGRRAPPERPAKPRRRRPQSWRPESNPGRRRINLVRRSRVSGIARGPERCQKREEVSVTSARAHAFFSRCSTRAASSLLPCATSAWCTPKSAHPFSRLRRDLPSRRSRLPRAGRRREAPPRASADRRMPIRRLGVGQPVLEPDGAIEMRERAIELLLPRRDVAVEHRDGDRDNLIGRIEGKLRHLRQPGVGGDRPGAARSSTAWSNRPCAANADPRAKCHIARVKSVSWTGFGSARISSHRPNRTIAK